MFIRLHLHTLKHQQLHPYHSIIDVDNMYKSCNINGLDFTMFLIGADSPRFPTSP